jgi:hypothetical protein
MSAFLDLYSLTLASGDPVTSNSPNLKFVEWKRAQRAIPVQNPKSEGLTVAPGVEATVFDGSRVLTVDSTTAFDLALSPLASDRYRITFVGGTDPGFRIDRGLNLSGVALALTEQANGSLLVVSGAGTPFAALQAGDEVFIPGMLTGDASSPFNPVNQGRWSVLGVGASGANVTLVRPAGQEFQGFTENVTPANAGQVLGYSSGGVQAGDGLDVSAGFASASRRTFAIVGVTSKWLEVQCSQALPADSAVLPGANGFKAFSSFKRHVRIESDQECSIRVNGDTSDFNRVSPWVAGDPDQIGEYVKSGPTWTLKVFNRSTQVANLVVLSAE